MNICQRLIRLKGDNMGHNKAYSAHHKPTGEDWLLLGINPIKDKVCAAGWPATIAKMSDCSDIYELRPLTDEEIVYRSKTFGEDWV